VAPLLGVPRGRALFVQAVKDPAHGVCTARSCALFCALNSTFTPVVRCLFCSAVWGPSLLLFLFCCIFCFPRVTLPLDVSRRGFPPRDSCSMVSGFQRFRTCDLVVLSRPRPPVSSSSPPATLTAGRARSRAHFNCGSCMLPRRNRVSI